MKIQSFAGYVFLISCILLILLNIKQVLDTDNRNYDFIFVLTVFFDLIPAAATAVLFFGNRIDSVSILKFGTGVAMAYSLIALVALLYGSFNVGIDYFKGKHDDIGFLFSYALFNLMMIIISALCACLGYQNYTELDHKRKVDDFNKQNGTQVF
ncbi:unnamed protein product [Bursaphelenchus okinawaensis]|uniref:Uncharacterized protein n=1 Tax=Bursaphelenchus okinawaensis TaxID=465554 RepID=A0A811JVX1_9BILA|nr:unnamed protein product [Bursaphelenchus okinawaensis]CAG9086242.1 unnamed protein product [Bursaphelenchus okinawaensis]